MRTTLFYLMLLVPIVILTSCSKPDLKESDDFTGLWNAYGYYDTSGYVPLEIIEISKTGPNQYKAVKILGDNGVETGMITWQGQIIGNHGIVTFTSGDGRGNYKYIRNVKLQVVSYDYIECDLLGKLVYVRRIDGYRP